MDSIGKRLEYLIEKKGITAYELSSSTGISQSTLSRIINKGSKPNLKNSEALAKYFHITKDWLINGSSEKEDSSQYTEVNEPSSNYLKSESLSIMQVPLVNQYAYAGYMSGLADTEYIETLPKIPFVLDKEYKGEYLCIEVKGDSMDDESHQSYLEGDILLCRNIRKEYWKSKLHINKWDFVIVHREKGIVVKRIIKHDVEKGIITLHSFNDYYSDYDVHLNDVDQILNIVDLQRKKSRR
jgi:transcriptional regulator with XRE-family HTH domain